MSEIILSPETARQVQERDPLFGRDLDDSRRGFLQLLRRVPGYIKSVTDQMQTEDVYRARIPRSVLDGLSRGEHEKVLKTQSGLWNGMIRKAKGKKVIVKQAEWEKVQLDRNSLANLNQMAMQASIADVTEQLFLMDAKLDLLMSGQHADRVAKVHAGVHQYEQAYDCRDLARRDQLLSNALQSLNEGRTALFGELEVMLTHQKRDPAFLDHLWRLLIRVDKPEVEFFNKLEQDRPKVAESIKYINLASAYIFRIYALLDEYDAADRSKQQYLNFCGLVLGNVKDEDSLHPYELVEGTRGLKQLGERAEGLTDCDADLLIEVTYEELSNAEV